MSFKGLRCFFCLVYFFLLDNRVRLWRKWRAAGIKSKKTKETYRNSCIIFFFLNKKRQHWKRHCQFCCLYYFCCCCCCCLWYGNLQIDEKKEEAKRKKKLNEVKELVKDKEKMRQKEVNCKRSKEKKSGIAVQLSMVFMRNLVHTSSLWAFRTGLVGQLHTGARSACPWEGHCLVPASNTTCINHDAISTPPVPEPSRKKRNLATTTTTTTTTATSKSKEQQDTKRRRRKNEGTM